MFLKCQHACLFCQANRRSLPHPRTHARSGHFFEGNGCPLVCEAPAAEAAVFILLFVGVRDASGAAVLNCSTSLASILGYRASRVCL